MVGAEPVGIGPLAFGVFPTSAQPYLPGFHVATWLRRLGKGLGWYARDITYEYIYINTLNVQKKIQKAYV